LLLSLPVFDKLKAFKQKTQASPSQAVVIGCDSKMALLHCALCCTPCSRLRGQLAASRLVFQGVAAFWALQLHRPAEGREKGHEHPCQVTLVSNCTYALFGV